MRAIIRFFTKEHLFGNLLTILILLAGIFSTFKIRRDIWPDVQFNISTVSAILPGASPEQVEKLVVNPIESSLKEVDGIKEVISTSTESQAVLVIRIDDKARDTEKIEEDIQNAVDQTEDLPTEVEKPIVRHVEAAQSPVIEVTVAGGQNELQLKNQMDYLADELSLIPEVARVVKYGDRKREYLVEADQALLAQKFTPLTSLVQAIKQQNVSVPAGKIQTNINFESLVRTEAQFNNPESILDTVIQANESGFITRVGDVAKAKETLAEPERLYRANGDASVNLQILKKANGDAIQLVKIVREKATAIAKTLDSSIKLGFSNDFSYYLTQRLKSLVSNLALGLILVLIILRLFLPTRITLIVAMGIPFSMLSAMSIAYFFDMSLNLINLIGLIIVVGMLVDDAVVVAENIWRRFEEGEPLDNAIIEGTREVFNPVMASVMTTVFAFAPMLFMTGIFGEFVFEIPFMVILALLFSVFEAFIIMPSHFASWVGPYLSQIRHTAADTSTFVTRLVEKYKTYIIWSLKHRYITLVALSAAVILPTIATGFMGRFILFPPEGIEIFFISVEAPIETPLAKTVELVKPIEKIIAEMDSAELKDFVSSVGIIQMEPNDPLTRRGSNFAHLRVGLTPESKRKRSADEIVNEVRKKIGTPEGVEKITVEYARQGPPQGQPISFSIWGDDFTEIRKAVNEVRAHMAKLEGVLDIRDSFFEGKNEWQVIPKKREAAMLGLTAEDISLAVRAALEGIVPTSVRKLDEEIDVRIKLQTENTDPKDLLKNLKIGNRQGNLVRLSSVADFELVPTISSVKHLDYRRAISVGSEVDLGKTTAAAVTAKLKPAVDGIMKKYPQMGVTWGGEDKDTQESMKSLGQAFLFAILIIFFLLIMTFKNLTQPFLVMLTIPMGLSGVMTAMLLHGRPFSFMALLGVVALAGVIVNNAIVLIDFVNSARMAGKSDYDSILDASIKRLRPILLTSITTICGLLPTAYGNEIEKIFGFGGGDPFIVPIALSLGWGLIFGTILTVMTFPAMVHILDDIVGLFSRKKTKVSI